MKEAVVFNLGCKVNQYESDVLGAELTKLGYNVSYQLKTADIYILNTCAVTAEAERKSRQAIARCRALNDKSQIFVCGCASQKMPTAFAKDNVIFVTGTAQKKQILQHLGETDYKEELYDLSTKYETDELTIPNRTRAYVKIQDGCNNFCSYCIIPYLRGRSRSKDIDSVVREVSALANYTSEIVLTGINLMDYGKDLGTNLTALIVALKDVDVRIRLGSFYAEGISAELLDALINLKNFCPHFHLSLQSGDKDVLKAMNRKYTPELYAEKIALIRKYWDNPHISTDIITGFPTETEENHRNTVNFIKQVAFSDIHVFPFSSRSGTRAAKLKCLPPEVVKARKEELLSLKHSLHSDFLNSNLNQTHSVLLEEKDGEYLCGFSKNYIKIYTKRGDVDKIIDCTPNEVFKNGLIEK